MANEIVFFSFAGFLLFYSLSLLKRNKWTTTKSSFVFLEANGRHANDRHPSYFSPCSLFAFALRAALASVIMSKGLFKFWDLSPLAWHIHTESINADRHGEIKQKRIKYTSSSLPHSTEQQIFSFFFFFQTLLRLCACVGVLNHRPDQSSEAAGGIYSQIIF